MEDNIVLYMLEISEDYGKTWAPFHTRKFESLGSEYIKKEPFLRVFTSGRGAKQAMTYQVKYGPALKIEKNMRFRIVKFFYPGTTVLDTLEFDMKTEKFPASKDF